MNPASLVKEKLMFFVKKLCKSHSKKHGVVPKGYIPMYVEGKRYKVPLKYLSRPAVSFQKLLEKSQTDVLDPKIEGPLVLRCTQPTTSISRWRTSRRHAVTCLWFLRKWLFVPEIQN
ncbi:unnamed protein product [Prunus brigantina]